MAPPLPSLFQPDIPPDVLALVGVSQALVAGAIAVTQSLAFRSRREVFRVQRCRPRMSVQQFRRKWSAPELRDRNEQETKQEFLCDLLRTAGFITPAEDRSRVRVAFEFPVQKPDGRDGSIDLVVGHVAVEVKRPGTPLAGALAQLQEYTVAYPRFSVLVVTNLEIIEVRGKGFCYRLALRTLDRRALKILVLALTDPDRLRRRFPFRCPPADAAAVVELSGAAGAWGGQRRRLRSAGRRGARPSKSAKDGSAVARSGRRSTTSRVRTAA
jgi:hypothetical protein